MRSINLAARWAAFRSRSSTKTTGFKPETGKQKTEKLIECDKVDFLAGYIWSNVLLASLKPAVDSKTFLITANAGPSQIAGELCSPYVFSTSWNNDQTPQSVGLYMNQKGVNSVFLIGPNYAAGKDMLAGVASTFKGKVVGQELTKWPYQLDFSAELAEGERRQSGRCIRILSGLVRASNSGRNMRRPDLKEISRSTRPSRSTSCRCHCRSEVALGVPGAQQWVNDLPNDANKKFVEDYRKKYNSRPSFYGAQSYDAAMLINSAIVATKGNLSRQERGARGTREGGFQIGALLLLVRAQPRSDPELLSAKCP